MKTKTILCGGAALALGFTNAAHAGGSVSGLDLQPQPINPVNPGTPVANPNTPVSTSASDLRSDSNSSATNESTAVAAPTAIQNVIAAPRNVNIGYVAPIKPAQTIYQASGCATTSARFSAGTSHGFGYDYTNGNDVYTRAEIVIPFRQGKCEERQERLAKINDEKHMSAMISQCIKWAKQGFAVKHCNDYGIQKIQVAQAPPPPVHQPVYHPPLPVPPPPPAQRVVTPPPAVPALWYEAPQDASITPAQALEAPQEIPVNW